MRGRDVLAVLAVLLVSLAVWAMPAKSYAAEGDVAQIERTGDQYATFDDAFAAAQDGDTITLLANAEVAKSLDKSVTIDGQNLYTLTSINHRYGFTWGEGRCLTFKDVTANFYYLIEIENPGSSSDLGLFYINGKGNAPTFYDDTFDFTFDNATINMVNGDDAGNAGATNRLHAIYYDSCGGTITMKNGSTVTITDFPEDAIEWGGQENSYLNIEDSTYISDSNRGGITGTWNVTINRSTVQVLDSDANGSNGGHFDINDSTVIFSGNRAHGLSTGNLFISNSTVTADNNTYIGIAVGRDLIIDNKSIVTVSGNAHGEAAGYAGMRLYGNASDGHDYQYSIDGTSTVNITNNKNTGLYVRYGTLSVADGAKLTITGNQVTNDTLDGFGGGLYVGYGANYDPVVTLPADTVIYNNHATTGGDDIYVSEGVDGPSLTFGQTGAGWALDGDPDCTDAIDGWYLDGITVAGALDEAVRWEAHASDPAANYAVEHPVNGTTTVTGLTALKAAHGIAATVTPADITIYMGGTEGYESVITGEQGTGDVVGTESNSLPEPGFYIALPECINEALKDEVGDTPGAVDLSDRITFRTATDDPADQREWHFEMYGATASVAYDRFVYRLVPAAGQDPIRLQFTSGDQFFTSDDFDPATIGRLNNQYTMGVYPGDVDQNNIVMDIEVGGRTYTYTVEVGTATLNIRYVTGEQADVVTDVVSDIADAPDAGERAYAVLPDGARYTINQSDIDIDVTADAAPSLLFDDVVSDENTAGAQNYDEQLRDCAVEVAAQNGAALESVGYEAKYLDLVDANNGNVWLQASEPVTVYWPYPEGTDQNTEFHLVHFEGLNRELANSEIAGGIANAPTSYIEVENTEHGIRFTTDGFSPFVLMWDASEESASTPDEPATKPEQPAPGEILAATGDSTPVLIAGIAAAGAACVAISFAVRKHGKA